MLKRLVNYTVSLNTCHQHRHGHETWTESSKKRWGKVNYFFSNSCVAPLVAKNLTGCLSTHLYSKCIISVHYVIYSIYHFTGILWWWWLCSLQQVTDEVVVLVHKPEITPVKFGLNITNYHGNKFDVTDTAQKKLSTSPKLTYGWRLKCEIVDFWFHMGNEATCLFDLSIHPHQPPPRQLPPRQPPPWNVLKVACYLYTIPWDNFAMNR